MSYGVLVDTGHLAATRRVVVPGKFTAHTENLELKSQWTVSNVPKSINKTTLEQTLAKWGWPVLAVKPDKGIWKVRADAAPPAMKCHSDLAILLIKPEDAEAAQMATTLSEYTATVTSRPVRPAVGSNLPVVAQAAPLSIQNLIQTTIAAEQQKASAQVQSHVGSQDAAIQKQLEDFRSEMTAFQSKVANEMAQVGATTQNLVHQAVTTVKNEMKAESAANVAQLKAECQAELTQVRKEIQNVDLTESLKKALSQLGFGGPPGLTASTSNGSNGSRPLEDAEANCNTKDLKQPRHY
eukprot:gnl/MRDRNA2_/MRDRNA2_33762_c0_seq1.p1 gnl/MRDRNA2_/MRDRNA2_33762_c0~~gnl/MRDRNA2_/MRDRNA2_33762_c0_seq1.p1  ORF type:complete len:326 (+),score=86.87 gnl/MRDRNA2_/MRDRNA2_33762_c0_seq1:93-980(+)